MSTSCSACAQRSQVTVLDMDLWGSSDNIGSHQLDLSYVYSKPNHEIIEQVRAKKCCARVVAYCAVTTYSCS